MSNPMLYQLVESTMDLTVYEGTQLILIDGKIMGIYKPGPKLTVDELTKAAVGQWKNSNSFLRDMKEHQKAHEAAINGDRWGEVEVLAMRQAQINKIQPQEVKIRLPEDFTPAGLAQHQAQLDLTPAKAPRNYSLTTQIWRLLKQDNFFTQYAIGNHLGIPKGNRAELRLILTRMVRAGTLTKAKGSHGIHWVYTRTQQEA